MAAATFAEDVDGAASLEAAQPAIAATERGDYKGAMAIFKALYRDTAAKPPSAAKSFYGLCLALAANQTTLGVALCRAAISEQPNNSRHYGNLVRLHLGKLDTKAAAEVLEEALAQFPKDALLLQMRDQMGLGVPPPIRSLRRDHILNRLLLAQKDSRQRGRFTFGSIHPAVGLLVVTLLFACVFGVTFWVLYRQAYP
jgi:hypothetical protein